MKHFLGGKSEIPNGNVLKRRLQSLAMLDAVLMPDWELRYFSFNSKWAENTMMASMRDGEGSEFFYLFDPAGACGKIFCPGQSEPDSLLDQIPKEFGSFLSKPAFNLQQITCCMWQRQTEVCWSLIPGQIKQIPLLAFAGDRGDYYRIWAEQYYERPVSSLGVIAIFNQQPITAELLLSLNEDLSLEGIVADADEIGYPVDQ